MILEEKLNEMKSAYETVLENTDRKVKAFPALEKLVKSNVTLYSVTDTPAGIKLKLKIKELDENKTISTVQKLVQEKLEKAGFVDVDVVKYGDNMLKISQPKKLFMKFQGKTSLNEDESLDEEFANLVLGSVNSKGRDGAVIYNPGKNKNIPNFCGDGKNHGMKVKVWKKHLENDNKEETIVLTLSPNGRWKI